MSEELGDRISTARRRAELTLKELARRVDISERFLSDIEDGRRSPSTKTMKKLRAALGFEPVRPLQPVYLDQHGTARFTENRIVRFLLDAYTPGLNDLACRGFSNEDFEQFAQLIGYSVSGFGDLSYVSDEAFEEAQGRVEKLIAEREKQS